jgi:hypothetical protein
MSRPGSRNLRLPLRLSNRFQESVIEASGFKSCLRDSHRSAALAELRSQSASTPSFSNRCFRREMVDERLRAFLRCHGRRSLPPAAEPCACAVPRSLGDSASVGTTATRRVPSGSGASIFVRNIWRRNTATLLGDSHWVVLMGCVVSIWARMPGDPKAALGPDLLASPILRSRNRAYILYEGLQIFAAQRNRWHSALLHAGCGMLQHRG